MNHELVVTVITALVSSGGGVGLLQWYLGKKQKDKDDLRDRQHRDSTSWYEQSRHHYEIAKDEAAQAKLECGQCQKALQSTRNAVYALLETLEDQIIPVLGLPEADIAETRKAMRTAVHQAREAL